MSSFKMIVTLVPHDKGEKLTQAAVKAGCGGGTVLMGRKLARTNFGAVLGFGDSSVDAVLMLVESEKASEIIAAIKKSTGELRPNFGELFTFEVDNMLRAGKIIGGENKVQKQTEREMISVIVNKGYADDVMTAARKAGAGGGTVINARGTAREDDEKFFGMHIVPEKEMLVMIVESEKKGSVVSAIKELKCLSEPGSGIAFCSGIDDFTLLGKNNS